MLNGTTLGVLLSIDPVRNETGSDNAEMEVIWHNRSAEETLDFLILTGHIDGSANVSRNKCKDEHGWGMSLAASSHGA